MAAAPEDICKGDGEQSSTHLSYTKKKQDSIPSGRAKYKPQKKEPPKNMFITHGIAAKLHETIQDQAFKEAKKE
jgi:hypothetical protein